MALRSPRLSEQEKKRILKLHGEGLSYAVISQRVGRPARTVSRVVQAAQKAQKKQPV
jgi:IS30 family transposase